MEIEVAIGGGPLEKTFGGALATCQGYQIQGRNPGQCGKVTAATVLRKHYPAVQENPVHVLHEAAVPAETGKRSHGTTRST